MKDNYLIRLEDLVNNPTPRVPICLCLDTSGSMAAVEGACETTGETIYQDGRTWNIATGGIRRVDELQKGVEKFYEAIREDEVAQTLIDRKKFRNYDQLEIQRWEKE